MTRLLFFLSHSLWAILAHAIDPMVGSLAISPNVCLSSPLLVPQTSFICGPSSLEMDVEKIEIQGIPSNNCTTGVADADSKVVWEGPHACAGLYCVYSSPAFAQGRGIVLLSTAENAAAVAKLSVFSSQYALFANRVYPDTTLSLFRVAEIPGKGKGLVATQPIRRGQRIMTNTPAVIIHRRLIDELSKAEQFRLLETGIARLPVETRRSFMAQMGHAGGHKIHDIMHTNSFEMGLGNEDGHHFGNFPEVSRFNHDCRPK